MTGYRQDGPEFNSYHCNIFLFSTASRLTLGPTQTPIQWVPGALPQGVEQQGHVAERLPPSSAEAQKSGAIPPLPHMCSWNSA
jgi:hypothetical protein